MYHKASTVNEETNECQPSSNDFAFFKALWKHIKNQNENPPAYHYQTGMSSSSSWKVSPFFKVLTDYVMNQDDKAQPSYSSYKPSRTYEIDSKASELSSVTAKQPGHSRCYAQSNVETDKDSLYEKCTYNYDLCGNESPLHPIKRSSTSYMCPKTFECSNCLKSTHSSKKIDTFKSCMCPKTFERHTCLELTHQRKSTTSRNTPERSTILKSSPPKKFSMCRNPSERSMSLQSTHSKNYTKSTSSRKSTMSRHASERSISLQSTPSKKSTMSRIDSPRSSSLKPTPSKKSIVSRNSFEVPKSVQSKSSRKSILSQNASKGSNSLESTPSTKSTKTRKTSEQPNSLQSTPSTKSTMSRKESGSLNRVQLTKSSKSTISPKTSESYSSLKSKASLSHPSSEENGSDTDIQQKVSITSNYSSGKKKSVSSPITQANDSSQPHSKHNDESFHSLEPDSNISDYDDTQRILEKLAKLTYKENRK